jgi:hypothetical protein
MCEGGGGGADKEGRGRGDRAPHVGNTPPPVVLDGSSRVDSMLPPTTLMKKGRGHCNRAPRTGE